MKVVMARRVCQNIESGRNAKEAGEEAIRYLEERAKGYGGVILIDRKGDMSFSYNTPRMAIASIGKSGDIFERI